MGNPGRSARVKVDPERLVGDLDRSEYDMLHEAQLDVEVHRIPGSKLRNGSVKLKRSSTWTVWFENKMERKNRKGTATLQMKPDKATSSRIKSQKTIDSSLGKKTQLVNSN